MNDLFLLAAHNTRRRARARVIRPWIDASAGAVRRWPTRSGCLLLLKLVAPPVMRVEWSASPGPRIDADSTAQSTRTYRQSRDSRPKAAFISLDRSTAIATAGAAATSVNEQDFATRVLANFGIEGGPIVFWFWLAGAVVCAHWSPGRGLCDSSDCYETRCRRPSGCTSSRWKSPAS